MNGFYDIVAVEGLSALRDINSLPKAIETAAVRAINRTADRTAADGRKRIREQVAFPARYLTQKQSDGQQRFGVTETARKGSLQATITGRHRPTSLARFVTGGRPGKPGVKITVEPGGTVDAKRMFLIRLRAGNADIETKSNLGLAIRLRQGETIENKKRMVQMGSGLYLLFGASVDQVFRTVREDVSPDAADFLEREFARLIEVDL